MTLSEIYRRFLYEMQTIYTTGEAARITSIAFESIAGIQRSDLIKDPAKSLPATTLHQLESALKRLLHHEPIQHVIGEAWFCNLALKVSADVLVPRPETEELVLLASNFIKDNNYMLLDIGTGSACIPIALKVKHKNIIANAIDVSEAALQIARHNAEKYAVNINFLKLDFLNESTWPELENLNVIVSNPPYIPETDKNLLDENVSKFEPHIALFEPAGQPLIFYRKIAKFGKSHLITGGKIFVEIHEDFGKEVLDIFQAEGFMAELKKDFFGKERFIVAGTVYDVALK